MLRSAFAPRALLLGLATFALGCAPEATPPAQTPPAPLPEIVSAAPAPGMVWVAGCWHWDGSGYVWLPGHWESPPAPETAAAAAAPDQ